MDNKKQRRSDPKKTIIPRPQTRNLPLPSQNGFYIFINPNDLLSRLPTELQWNIVKYLSLRDISSLQQANKILRNAVGTAGPTITNSLTGEDRDDLRSVLYDSIRKGNPEAVKNILSINKGREPLDLNEIPFGFFHTPLVEAVKSGNLKIVKALIENGADPNKEDNGNTPLHLASMNGHLDVVKYLIEEAKVNKDITNNDGNTPLHLASVNGHLNVVQYLVKNGASKYATPKYNLTPLYLAAAAGHLNVVQYLVGVGSNKDAASAGGQTPLHGAAGDGHLDVVRYLVGVGSNKDAKDVWGDTPFQVAAKKGHLDVVKYFIEEAGANKDITNISGETPIFTAAERGHFNVVQYLVENAGADLNRERRDGQTPLEASKTEIANYLRSKGAR